MDTIRKSVVNIVALLLLMMLLFAIMGYYLFTYDIEINSVQEQIYADLVRESWGNLGSAMLSLFTFVTVSVGSSHKYHDPNIPNIFRIKQSGAVVIDISACHL
jgi:hypothetical protein